MVNREDCVKTINEFIKTKDLKNAATLFRYLCELKGEGGNYLVEEICAMPPLLSGLMRQTLETLEIELKINRITDKNNNLILVF